MSTEIDLEMSRSLERIDKDDFADVFYEELESNEYGLTSDEYSDGGWPDLENAHAKIDDVKGAPPRVTVSVTVEYTTCYSSGCADMPRRNNGFVKYDVVLDQAEERAYMIWTGGGTYDRPDPFEYLAVGVAAGATSLTTSPVTFVS